MSSDQRLWHCKHPGCKYVTSHTGHLNKHFDCMHAEVKPAFPCEHPDCEYVAKRTGDLNRHFDCMHAEVKRAFPCEHPDCKFVAKRKDHLKEHFDCTHLGLKRPKGPKRPQGPKNFLCDDPGCKALGVAYNSACKLEAHRVAFHTTQGRQRRKLQEEAMKKALVVAGYVESFERGRTPAPGEFVREVYFDHRCALGRQFAQGEKKFAYVDFVVRCKSGRLVFLEVDESQHESYGQLCESTRMWNICESIVLAGENINVFWLRFHPDRHFEWNGKDTHFKPSERREQVVKFLDALQQSPTDPPMQVGYAYYDHNQFRALATLDDEFHTSVKPAVVCIHHTDFLLAPPESLCFECDTEQDTDANEDDQSGECTPKRARVQ